MAVRRASNCAVHFLVDLMSDKPATGADSGGVAPETGQTVPSRLGEPVPRLPHERDQSSDSQLGVEDERIGQAARDLADGQQDTGRTPVVTELTRTEFPPDTDKKAKKTDV